MGFLVGYGCLDLLGCFLAWLGLACLLVCKFFFFSLLECLLGWAVSSENTPPPKSTLTKQKNHIIFPFFFWGLFTIFRSSEPFGACWVARAAVCRAAPSARRCWRHSRRQARQPSLPRQRNAGAKWEGQLP